MSAVTWRFLGRGNVSGPLRIILTLVLSINSISHAVGEDRTKAALRTLYDQLRPFVSPTEAERAALAKRGQVAVYFPIGANDRGFISEIKYMQMESYCVFVNDEAIQRGVLTGKSLLILPDLCEYESQPERDRKIKDHLENGGGIYAIGSGIRYLHGLGLFEAELITFRARGQVRSALEGQNMISERLPKILGEAAPILKKAFDDKLLGAPDIFVMNSSFIQDGPLFRLPSVSPLTVLAAMAVTEMPDNSWPTIPGMAYGSIGKGRLVILSGGRTGANSEGAPIDATESLPAEPNSEDISNLIRPIVHRQLILYASGDPMSPLVTKAGGK